MTQCLSCYEVLLIRHQMVPFVLLKIKPTPSFIRKDLNAPVGTMRRHTGWNKNWGQKHITLPN